MHKPCAQAACMCTLCDALQGCQSHHALLGPTVAGHAAEHMQDLPKSNLQRRTCYCLLADIGNTRVTMEGCSTHPSLASGKAASPEAAQAFASRTALGSQSSSGSSTGNLHLGCLPLEQQTGSSQECWVCLQLQRHLPAACRHHGSCW